MQIRAYTDPPQRPIVKPELVPADVREEFRELDAYLETGPHSFEERLKGDQAVHDVINRGYWKQYGAEQNHKFARQLESKSAFANVGLFGVALPLAARACAVPALNIFAPFVGLPLAAMAAVQIKDSCDFKDRKETAQGLVNLGLGASMAACPFAPGAAYAAAGLFAAKALLNAA